MQEINTSDLELKIPNETFDPQLLSDCLSNHNSSKLNKNMVLLTNPQVENITNKYN
jgi:hypothetical protein